MFHAACDERDAKEARQDEQRQDWLFHLARKQAPVVAYEMATGQPVKPKARTEPNEGDWAAGNEWWHPAPPPPPPALMHALRRAAEEAL